MDSKTNILYLSHVNWNWIKQRPQYIAEELYRSFDLTYFYPQTHRNMGLKENDPGNMRLQELPRIPTLGDKIALARAINDRRATAIIESASTEHDRNLIWMCGPTTLNWIPASFKGPVVYDCMDDHGAFGDGLWRTKQDALEREVVSRADLILASSARLLDKMHSMDSTGKKEVLLVRNGFSGKVLPSARASKPADTKQFTACYFGTISSWFDFDLVKESLSRFPNLTYKIIGPIEHGVEVPEDPRIEFVGPVAHDSLPDYVADCDCLIMPFIVNELILSVDPVKLYEYVNLGKDIVCVRYPEVERFSDFAELYNGSDEYCASLERVMASEHRKYNEEQRLQLLSESSWHARMKPVLQALAELD